MPIILPANSAISGGYNVSNSCMFNDDDSSCLTKTQGGSATNNKICTFSAWVKRGNNTDVRLFSAESSSFGIQFWIILQGAGPIYMANYETSYSMQLITSAKFLDPSAWYHLCIAIDTTESTSTDRVKIYVNGVRETSFSTSTFPSQNLVPNINDASINLAIGKRDAEEFMDGYLAEVAFIDGSALAPTAFGEFDEDSPTIWKPKEFKDDVTFGSNGYYLDFADSGDLGDDESGNTNDWTEVNLAATDQATDTPTNNFCTANPLDQNGSYTLSQGNCQIASGHTSWYNIGSTMAVANGKWYWEVEFDAGTMIEIMVGFHDTSANRTGTNAWVTGSTLFYNDSGGEIRTDGTDSTANYGTLSAGDILGIALNMDDKQITLLKNGSAIASNVAISTSITEAVPTFFTDANNVVFKANFGGSPSFTVSSGNADADGYGNFEYAPPSGYYALCTKNLAEYG